MLGDTRGSAQNLAWEAKARALLLGFVHQGTDIYKIRALFSYIRNEEEIFPGTVGASLLTFCDWLSHSQLDRKNARQTIARVAGELAAYDSRGGEGDFRFLQVDFRNQLLDYARRQLPFMNEIALLPTIEAIASGVIWEIQGVPMIWLKQSDMPVLFNDQAERIWVSREWLCVGSAGFSFFVPGFNINLKLLNSKTTLSIMFIEDACPACGMRGKYCSLGPVDGAAPGCGRQPIISTFDRLGIPRISSKWLRLA